MMFYSPSTKGFYDSAIHGSRTILVENPAWERPTTKVADPNYRGDGDAPLIDMPDMNATPDMIEVDNPACKIPVDAKEISKEDHISLMQQQTEGKTIVPDKKGLPVAVEPVVDLDLVKASAMKAIDAQAEEARQRFITSGTGQAMVYQRKVQEAETLEFDQSPDPARYPLLSAEIGLTGDTLQMVGEAVLAQRDAWLAVAAVIENIRLSAKRDIKASETAKDVNRATVGWAWPHPEE